MHVTLRSGLRSLRTQYVFPTIRGAISDANRRGGVGARSSGRSGRSKALAVKGAAAARTDFRVIHFSVQGDHLHLIVEARHKRALSNGVRGLAVSLARRLNALISRQGRVFVDRWHGRALTTPRAVRRVLVYVLFNFHKHGRVVRGRIDPFSSAPYFGGFRELRGRTPIENDPAIVPRALAPPDTNTPPIARAGTWLLALGWQRFGAISLRERPAAPAAKSS